MSHNLRHRVKGNLFPQFATETDYLRYQLLIPMTASNASPQYTTTAAWHPLILEYCRTLGADADAVDRLFQRIVVGDLADRRAVTQNADQAFAQLDIAIDRAHQQWLSGEPVIRGTSAAQSSGETPDDENEARHSDDFASVWWYGTEYTFTTNQALCVKVLWSAWTNKTATMSGPEILDQANISQERFDKVFRVKDANGGTKAHAAWQTMIFSPLRGRYCLKRMSLKSPL